MSVKKIKLGSFGDVELSRPDSMASAIDIVFEHSAAGGRARFARLCAAAIGVSCRSLGAPRYSVGDCDPIAYGARLQDWLITRGVSLADLMNSGTEALLFLTAELPSEEEVERREDFLSESEVKS
jgi:hypothetical protein